MTDNQINIPSLLRGLRHNLQRLAAEQGPRARRNARLAIRAELRAISRWLDENYPAPPRKRKGGPRLSATARGQRLLQHGWILLADFPTAFSVAAHAAACATRTIMVNATDRGRVLPEKRPAIYVRTWTYQIWLKYGVIELAKAVKSSQHRKALLVALALTKTSTAD